MDKKSSKLSNVVYLPCQTTLDIAPDRVLECAHDKLESAIVIGEDKEGNLYFASSMGDNAHTLWFLEQAKQFLLKC